MRRFLAVAIVGSTLTGVGLVAGCGSFGSDSPLGGVAVPPEAGSDVSTTPLDAADEASLSDGGVETGAPAFCKGKSFVICSDFEQSTTDLLVGGWDRVDPGSDLFVETRPGVGGGHRLHVKVPSLPSSESETQALRKEVPVPASLVFAATLQMGLNAVTEYTEVLSIETPQDPSGLQITAQLLNGDLSIMEASHPNGMDAESSLVALGPLGALKAIRLEVHLWFGAKNEVAVFVDGAPRLARSSLGTLPVGGAPAGQLIFSAGRPYAVGAVGTNGGTVYLDDVTLEMTPQ